MVKSYVRWQQAGAFGVLSSGPVAHVSATTVASAALETVALLSLRQGAALARALTPAAASGPDTAASSSPPPEVTSLATVPGEAAAARLAAGYSDGSARRARPPPASRLCRSRGRRLHPPAAEAFLPSPPLPAFVRRSVCGGSAPARRR